MMTSFPVFIKLGITSKGSVLELKLHRNTYYEIESCGSESYITFHFGRPLAEKSLITSFPVSRNTGITSKGSVLEQNLHRNTTRKQGFAVPSHILLFILGDT